MAGVIKGGKEIDIIRETAGDLEVADETPPGLDRILQMGEQLELEYQISPEDHDRPAGAQARREARRLVMSKK